MIVELISKYLETHKRLVIPNLGTFIVKVPGESVLFSNLIKNDDGVLRSLLAADGVSEMEAAAAVDRFVFEVRFRLQNNGVCRLGGFGELRSGANETVTFVYSPATQGDRGVDVVTAQEEKAASAAPRAAVVPEASPVQKPVQPAQPSPRRAEPARAVSADTGMRDGAEPRRVASGPAVQRPEAAYAEPKADADEERRQRQDVRRDRMKALYDEPHVSVSPKRHPADYVKGLRYGKGRKGPADRDMGSRSRRRNDRILIIAIVAAALAIAALGYGYYCDVRAARMENEYYGVEQEESVPNPDMEYIENE